MKKTVIILLAMTIMIAITGCDEKEYAVSIIIPAGSTEQFVYSDEEISLKQDKLKISAGDGLGDTEVVLKMTEGQEENAYELAYLTPGTSVEMAVRKGAWFRIGISVQNASDTDKQVSVLVQDANIRISGTANCVCFSEKLCSFGQGFLYCIADRKMQR